MGPMESAIRRMGIQRTLLSRYLHLRAPVQAAKALFGLIPRLRLPGPLLQALVTRSNSRQC